MMAPGSCRGGPGSLRRTSKRLTHVGIVSRAKEISLRRSCCFIRTRAETRQYPKKQRTDLRGMSFDQKQSKTIRSQKLPQLDRAFARMIDNGSYQTPA
jgi:hypothetical protein